MRLHTNQSHTSTVILSLVTLAIGAILVGTAILSLPTAAQAQVEAPTALPATPTTNTTPDSHAEADAVFNRLTVILAPLIAVVLVIVIVVHRRSLNRREAGGANPSP